MSTTWKTSNKEQKVLKHKTIRLMYNYTLMIPIENKKMDKLTLKESLRKEFFIIKNTILT